MTTDISANTYIIDVENGAEIARLINQSQMFTRAMGGLFPEQLDLSTVERVLDLGCGPGDWVTEVAFAHQDMDVVGVDIDAGIIAYARALAQVQRLENARFEVMDIKKPLAFTDQSFDLIHGRFLVGFMEQSSWPGLLAECRRVLAPGGILCLTECEYAVSSSPAFQQLNAALCRTLSKQERTFSRDGCSIGIAHMLGKLLSDAGFERIGKRAFLLDASVGSDLSHSFCKDMQVLFALLRPYLVKAGMKQATFDTLYDELLLDMFCRDFRCLSFGLSAWGRKT